MRFVEKELVVRARVLPATNTKRTRIKSDTETASRTFPYNHAFDECENIRAAARSFLVELLWEQNQQLVVGSIRTNPLQVPKCRYCAVLLKYATWI